MQHLTVKKWNYLLIKSSVLFVAFLLSITAQAQQLLYEIEVGEVASVDIDRKGYVYVADEQGNVSQWIEGEKKRWYSPSSPAEVQIDAWAMLNTVLFSEDWQGIRILGQQLTEQSEYIFDPSLVEYASVATNASDGGIWLYDQGSFRLKKYFPDVKTISIDVPLEQLINSASWEPVWMREHQNNLYVLDRYRGIFTFDLLGNILSEPYAVKKAKKIGLTSEEVYWLEKDELHFKALYSLETRYIKLPLKKVEYALYDHTAQRVFCFKQKMMYAYQL
ncbi:hypothetical protein [Flammeovirga aprica]|nr:hypothetical protein [Flammeovirga aprica]